MRQIQTKNVRWSALKKKFPQIQPSAKKNWRAFRICGTLDFSLVGIISNIASALAKEHIPIFAVSTFNTDYIFVKAEYFAKAVQTLRDIGCQIKNVIYELFYQGTSF